MKSESPGGAGIQPAAGFSPPSWYATNFSGFVSLKSLRGEAREIRSGFRGSRLKAGFSLKGRPTKAKAERRISQPWLRVASETRSRRNTRELREWSVGRPPERPSAGARLPARTKGQSREGGLKGRLQARLPATQVGLPSTNGQPPVERSAVVQDGILLWEPSQTRGGRLPIGRRLTTCPTWPSVATPGSHQDAEHP
jgi:hypothetical protein